MAHMKLCTKSLYSVLGLGYPHMVTKVNSEPDSGWAPPSQLPANKRHLSRVAFPLFLGGLLRDKGGLISTATAHSLAPLPGSNLLFDPTHKPAFFRPSQGQKDSWSSRSKSGLQGCHQNPKGCGAQCSKGSHLARPTGKCLLQLAGPE